MIIYGIVRLQLYCTVVTINRHVILFEGVVSCTEVAVVRRNLRIQFDSHLDKLDFFIVVSHLPVGLSLQVPKLTLFLQVQTDVTALNDILPPLEAHVGIGSQQVGILVIL